MQNPEQKQQQDHDEQEQDLLLNSDETFSARTSFTADSPYYTSYVETEMRQVQVLSQTLQDISARAKTFGKCGALMAEATRRLALACRLKPSSPNEQDDDGKGGGAESIDRIVKERQEAVGEEMMVVLSTLGEVCISMYACMHCSKLGVSGTTRSIELNDSILALTSPSSPAPRS
jgi:hypothetical protein